jgi:F-type H+-transporting ATPase subunit b
MEFAKEFFSEAETWVGVGLLIFLGILVAMKVPAALAKTLDARSATIQSELDEAARIRAEAEAMLKTLTAEREAAEAQARDMIEAARAEAKRLEAEAKVRLEETLARREKLAERKIAQAEADAQAAVKAAAVDLATKAAEAILAERLSGLKSDPMVDDAIKGLAGRLQ